MASVREREWFDDDDFWIHLFPFMFPEKRFEDAPEQMDKALRLLGVETGAALDLCCGPGRCSAALAQRGFAVTGVDRTGFLLEEARKRTQAAEATIEWVQADMRDFVRPATFDLVISMFTSFGYFDDKGEDLLVLRNIHASLKPGVRASSR